MKTKRVNLSKVSVQAILFWGLFIVIWILCGLNTKTVDREQYEMFYEYAKVGINYPGVEIGYSLFERLCCFFNMSYQSFFCVYSLVALFLIASSVRTYAKSKALLVLIVFMFFPLFHIFVAQRNFMAFAIMTYAVRYLLADNTFKNNIKYVALIFIASLFHVSSIIYLSFLLTRLSYKYTKIIVYFFVVTIMLFLLFENSIKEVLVAYIPKLSHYFVDESGTRFATKVFLIIYFFAKLFLASLILCYLDSEKKVFMQISILISFMLPLGMVNMNFLRYEYNTIVFFLIAILDMRKPNGQSLEKYNIVKFFSVVFYLISGFILLYLFSFDSVVMMVLRNNLIY